MTVRVRFAPSPTGKLHVGNIRTALINWLFARARDGEFVLRIDDTDTQRSTKEAEEGIYTDLNWLGLVWNETFRQSERFRRYEDAADVLRAKGFLYPCYETEEELERRRKILLSRGRPPVYDRAALKLTGAERAAIEAEGRRPHWRFKLSGEYVHWRDLVRGDQSIDTASLSDPILVREDGSWLYTMPSVVDDIDARISHIVRGEDHVTNSAAQIEIFKALGADPPELAHTPLLIGADGQGLSKRLGSLSMGELRAAGFEPMAILSLLAKLGTSDAVEARRDLPALAAEFDFAKIGRAPARFDEAELNHLNAQIIREFTYEQARDALAKLPFGDQATPMFWEVVRGNIELIPDAAAWLANVYGPEVQAANSPDPEIRGFLNVAATLFPTGGVTLQTWKEWTDALKAATGRKGKDLYAPLRLALTGQERGPEMDRMVALLGSERILARLQKAAS